VVLKTEIRRKGEDLVKAQKEHEKDVSRAKIVANNVAKPKDLENLEKEAADTMVVIYSSISERTFLMSPGRGSCCAAHANKAFVPWLSQSACIVRLYAV
jgi:hypothetical protein